MSIHPLYLHASFDPQWAAHACQLYCARHSLTTEDLAAYLGLPVDRLPFFGMCRAPRDRAGCMQIAAGYGLDVERVVEVLLKKKRFLDIMT